MAYSLCNRSTILTNIWIKITILQIEIFYRLW